MKFTYCPDCSEKLSLKEIGDEGLVPFCEKCGRPWFSFSYPCVICLVTDETGENVALIKQSYVSDNYICVAGYVKEGENLEYTAKREVSEETGLEVVSVRYVKSRYYEKRDNLMCGFVCTVKKGNFDISSEVDSASWFTLDEAEKRLRKGSIAWQLFREYADSIK
ncbi:MAG: NUDIX domain-containing protein [Oscillospiraceae bacterium]|nr:NUDIX domain-containing protein [Oscillospiraceae bacterium]